MYKKGILQMPVAFSAQSCYHKKNALTGGKSMQKHVIGAVAEGSIADELEIEPGDELVSINGKTIEDVFDYHYLTNDEYLTMLVKKADGEEWELEIEKDLE